MMGAAGSILYGESSSSIVARRETGTELAGLCSSLANEIARVNSMANTVELMSDRLYGPRPPEPRQDGVVGAKLEGVPSSLADHVRALTEAINRLDRKVEALSR